MIGRKFRFHGYNSLRQVYQNGQTTRNSLMALKYLNNPRRKSFRLAIVVSRKVHKSAVVRNRIRRRLYEQFRIFEKDFANIDMVLTVFSDQVATMPSSQLQQSLHTLLSNARLIGGANTESHAIVRAKEN